MESRLRVAIIGCGGIAQGKHMPSLSRLKNAELVAFCDEVYERAEKAANQYGVKGGRIYRDYKELLKDSTIDVVHVCTPNNTHAEISIAAMEAGKHVMCEKPMAINTVEAKKMLEATRRTGKKLSIGYNNRFRKDSLYLKELISRGELGEIYFAKAHAVRRRGVPTWGVFLDEEKQGGGPLIDIGTHSLDLALWLMNNYKPEAVLGTTYHKLSQKENAANSFGSWDPKNFKVEDSAFGFIRMQNGATIILESSWALNTLEIEEAKVTLSGTEAGADMRDGLTINGEEFGELYTKKVNLNPKGVDFFEGNAENNIDIEMRLWIDSILNDKEPLVKPEEAFVVTQILEAIYESAKTGKTVYFENNI